MLNANSYLFWHQGATLTEFNNNKVSYESYAYCTVHHLDI